MLAAAMLAIVIAALVVRIGWGGVRGAGPVGWALAGAATIGGSEAAGAWGVACVGLTGIAAILVVLATAAWRSPRRRVRPAPAPTPLAPIVDPRDWARRGAVFLLVVPGGFAAAAILALGCQHCARLHGMAPADATVIGWFAQPVAWAALMLVQLTLPSTAAMLLPLALVAGAGGLAWVGA